MTADATLVQLYNCCITAHLELWRLYQILVINPVGRCRKTHQTRGKVLLFYPPVLVNLWEVNLQFTVLSVHQLTRCFNVCCIFSDTLYKIPCLQQKVHGLTGTVILKHPPPTSGTNRECLPRWDCIDCVFLDQSRDGCDIQKISDRLNWHKQLSYILSHWNNFFSP